MQLLRDNLTLWTSDMQEGEHDSPGHASADAGEDLNKKRKADQVADKPKDEAEEAPKEEAPAA